jgi:hypothetical protein
MDLMFKTCAGFQSQIVVPATSCLAVKEFSEKKVVKHMPQIFLLILSYFLEYAASYKPAFYFQNFNLL